MLLLPFRDLRLIPKPDFHEIGLIGALLCQTSWQRWTNAKYGMLWTNNKKCEWWELHRLILAKLTVVLASLQPTKPTGLLKATLS